MRAKRGIRKPLDVLGLAHLPSSLYCGNCLDPSFGVDSILITMPDESSLKDPRAISGHAKQILKRYFFPILERVHVEVDDTHVYFREKQGSVDALFAVDHEALLTLDSETRIGLIGALTPLVLTEFVQHQLRFIPPNDGYDELALLIKSSGISDMLYWMLNVAIFSIGTKCLYDYGVKHAWEEVTELWQEIKEARYGVDSDRLKHLYSDFTDHCLEFVSLTSMMGGTTFGVAQALSDGVEIILKSRDQHVPMSIPLAKQWAGILSTGFLGLGSFLTVFSGARQLSKTVNDRETFMCQMQDLESVLSDISSHQSVMCLDQIREFKSYLSSEESLVYGTKLTRGLGLMLGGVLLAMMNAWKLASTIWGSVAMESMLSDGGVMTVLALGVGLVFMGLSCGIFLERREQDMSYAILSGYRLEHDFKLEKKQTNCSAETFIKRRIQDAKRDWHMWADVQYCRQHLYLRANRTVLPEGARVGRGDRRKVFSELSDGGVHFQKAHACRQFVENRWKGGHFSQGVLSVAEFNCHEGEESLPFLDEGIAHQTKDFLCAYLSLDARHTSEKMVFDHWVLYLNSKGLLPTILHEMTLKDWFGNLRYVTTPSLQNMILSMRVVSSESRGFIGSSLVRPIFSGLNSVFGTQYFNDTNSRHVNQISIVDLKKILASEGTDISPVQRQFLEASAEVFFESTVVDKQLRADIIQAVRFAARLDLLTEQVTCSDGCGGVHGGREGHEGHSHGKNAILEELEHIQQYVRSSRADLPV